MSGFDRHSRDAILWGGVACTLAFALLLSNGHGLEHASKVAVGVGVAGAALTVFPDVDHQDSKPRRYLVALGSAAGIVGLAYVWSVGKADVAGYLGGVLQMFSIEISPMPLVLLTLLLLAISLPWALDRSIDTLTVNHRNWTHSPLAGFLAASLIVAALWKYSLVEQAKVAWALGFLGAGGIAVHIGRDWTS